MICCLRQEVGGKLFPKQCKQQRQDDADQNGGGDWKVEREFLLLNDDITGEFAYPWNLLPNQKKNTYSNDKNAQKNEQLSQSAKTKHLTRL